MEAAKSSRISSVCDCHREITGIFILTKGVRHFKIAVSYYYLMFLLFINSEALFIMPVL